jgi:4-hydroxybenzoate polyprenyltransferase
MSLFSSLASSLAELKPWVRLGRFDKPVGIALLVFPAWWAVVLATMPGEAPNFSLMLLFLAGAVVMRAGGCAINDIADRKYDAQVARTKDRPVASGKISVVEAATFAAVMLGAGFLIALPMGLETIVMAACALPFILLYPLMKRFTWWPQAWLALTFNWGVFLGFMAVEKNLPLAAITLFGACFFWTLGYDTIYAFQDVADDEKAGVKSTARLLGKHAKAFVGLCYAFSFIMLLVAGVYAHIGLGFYVVMSASFYELCMQLKNWRLDDAGSSGAVFRSNVGYGLLVTVALLAGRL